MKLLKNNVRALKRTMSYAEIEANSVKLIRQELNSKNFTNLGAVAMKVIEYYKENGESITFMNAMDIVDRETQKLLSALKECAI